MKIQQLLPALVFCVYVPVSVSAAETTASDWQNYDQSADLAVLAAHENESMRFQLLASPVQDKRVLWQPFADALGQFGQARYEHLKPLILERPVTALQDAVASGLFSYAELTTFYLYRMRAIETDAERFLNSIISLNPDAIARAQQLDVQRDQGQVVTRDSLFGIPILLKDNIGAAGLPTTAGALALADNRTGDAFITARLREKGAVILGKANLSEWAYFFCEQCPSGYSALGGQTLNPYGRFDFGTGGSSSGSAVAVAANLAAVAVGSETSGSILSPASANSTVGLKPTTGTLSRSGIIPISASLDTAGPITRSVHDAVILFNAMAGFDEADTAMPRLSQNFRLQYRMVDISAWRLGALEQFSDNANYREALSILSAANAELIDVVIPTVDTEGFGQLLGGEMRRDLALYLDQYADAAVDIDSIASLRDFNALDLALRAPYGQELIVMMDELELTSEQVENLRQRLQGSAREALNGLFADSQLDVLLSMNNRTAGLAALANYPALTLPLGYEDNGRPLGLTLIAPPFAEQRLVDLGARFEILSQARRMPAAYQ